MTAVGYDLTVNGVLLLFMNCQDHSSFITSLTEEIQMPQGETFALGLNKGGFILFIVLLLV
jgi:hypothetical protein